ncbi:MAG TPA: PDZ domain-containing protein, partial [Candidatus Acidoferrum sp.]
MVTTELTLVVPRRTLRLNESSIPNEFQVMRPWSALPRPFLVFLALLLAGPAFLYGSLWMYEARFPVTLVELGFNFLHSEEYDQKTHSIFVHDVVKNSPAERAGLRAGDRIIAVNGEILSTSAPYDKLYATAHPGDPVALTITHDGEPAPLELHGTFRARPSVLVQEGLARSTAQQILALYPALFLLVGFAVLFLKLDDPYAWLLALMFCAFAGAADILNPRVLSPSMQAFLFAFRAVFNGLLCALFYLFFARFPVRSPLDRFLPWLKWFGLALAVVTVFPALPTGEPKFPAIVSETLGDSATRILFLISRYGLLLLGLVSLVQNASLAAVPAGARRKSRVILLGSIFGVLPILLERALRDFTGFRLSYWFDTIVVLILFFYPLSFAYAVVKHRVMEIPVLLRRSAHYVLVQKGFTVSLFVMAVTVISLFTHLFSRFVQANPNLGMALGAVFGIALVWLSAPAIRKITLRIDRAFFRSSYDASKILQDLAEKIRAAGGRAELAALLEKYVHDALHPKTFACFLDENGSHLSAVRGTVPPRLQTIRKDDTFLMRMAEGQVVGLPLLSLPQPEQRCSAGTALPRMPRPHPGSRCRPSRPARSRASPLGRVLLR